jgi:hypothetical protein
MAERASDGCGGIYPVVVAPEPGERSPADVPVLEIELSRVNQGRCLLPRQAAR